MSGSHETKRTEAGTAAMPKILETACSFSELMSNLVYRLHDSGDFPADRSFVNAVNKFHLGDDVGELAETA